MNFWKGNVTGSGKNRIVKLAWWRRSNGTPSLYTSQAEHNIQMNIIVLIAQVLFNQHVPYMAYNILKIHYEI